jgi:hypothetical protein
MWAVEVCPTLLWYACIVKRSRGTEVCLCLLGQAGAGAVAAVAAAAAAAVLGCCGAT